MNIQKALDDWYSRLERYKNGLPARGTLAGALVVAERLKEDFQTNLDFHTAKGGAQIKGASGAAVKKILLNLGESRKFSEEGGRTNRGLRSEIGSFLAAIDQAGLRSLGAKARLIKLNEVQLFLLARIRDFFNQQRIKFVYSPDKSTAHLIGDILAAARLTGKEGAVAQYLVGAKLQLRFPEETISNESFSAADMQTGRHGDFSVKDTAFHVTVAPMQPVFDKCLINLQAGKRAFLLVPVGSVEGARQNANNIAAGRIDVAAIETFVGFNVDEIACFGKNAVSKALSNLLDIYNQRVSRVETDLSLMIDVPKNLKE